MNYGIGRCDREFDRSFTIPRRREDTRDYFTTSNFNSVLTNNYGNIPTNYPRQQSFTSNYREVNNQMLNNDFKKKWWNDASNSRTPQIDNGSQNLQKRTWTSANFTPATEKYRDTFGDLYDRTLPKELLLLYQPLFCKLCSVQLSSNTMAKLHYKSKNHEKKVRAWLIDYSARTGEPLHERATAKKLKKEEEYDPKYYHCDICDLDLTGKLHAESHYMGKNHQRAVMDKKDPAGKGFYNDDGKWVRTVAAKDDKSGRDGFGQEFTKKERQALQQQILQKKSFKCEMCDILVTSESQMEAHVQGQKHKKKLIHKETGFTIAQTLADKEDHEVNASGNETVPSDSDPMASYRTPSGYFYCKTCDLSLNSNVQFMQHLKSKKHKRKHTDQSVQNAQGGSDLP